MCKTSCLELVNAREQTQNYAANKYSPCRWQIVKKNLFAVQIFTSFKWFLFSRVCQSKGKACCFSKCSKSLNKLIILSLDWNSHSPKKYLLYLSPIDL